MPLTQKRLMILGAGPFQLPAIQKAVALGYHVITVDYLPDNVGHRFSHQYINCSTTDRDGVARAAAESRIDGICTFGSDVAIPAVGYTCELLDLPGVSFTAAETMSMKHRFRTFLRDRRLSHPRFVIARSYNDLGDLARDVGYPMVFKPVDTSGSRGVTKLPAPDERAANAAFERARSYSRSGTVCVEEFVAGIEVGGDGILRDGQFAFIAITHKHLDGFVVRGHNLPTNIDPDDQRRVRLALEKCCVALGYRNGPLNFDVMVSSERVVILEMSARNGGNGIPAIISRSTEVDVEVATMKFALGEGLELPVDGPSIRGVGSLIFGSEQAGVLRGIRDLADIRTEIPEVFDLYLAVLPGSVVNRFEHNGNLIGCALFDCEPPGSYDAIATRIIQALRVVVAQAD